MNPKSTSAAAPALPRKLFPVQTARPGRALAASVLALAALLAPGLPRAEAKGFASTAFVQPADLVAFQGFGAGVVADGNVMAVGTQFAPFVVYVYANTNGAWIEQARLTSPAGSTTDRFGSSLALQGNTLVVGAAGAHTAYLYTNIGGAWINTGTLMPSGGSGGGFAGSIVNGVAINGSTIAVGAPAESTGAGNTGSVYIFANVGGAWVQQQRIEPTDPQVSDFGECVALQNDTLVVGAPFSSSAPEFMNGAAFVYTRQGGAWTEQARLNSTAPVTIGLYGFCVSLDGTTIVVGAPGASEAQVFVEANGTWTPQTMIVGPEDSDFGTGLKVIGDLLMVAAYDDFVVQTGTQSGDAFVYARGGSTWTQQTGLFLAPGVHGVPGPAEDLQRFGNFATMTKSGSQTIFVFGSQTFSNLGAARVGAVYTATLN